MLLARGLGSCKLSSAYVRQCYKILMSSWFTAIFAAKDLSFVASFNIVLFVNDKVPSGAFYWYVSAFY